MALEHLGTLNQRYPSGEHQNIEAKRYAEARGHQVKWQTINERFLCACGQTFYVRCSRQKAEVVGVPPISRKGVPFCEKAQGDMFP